MTHLEIMITDTVDVFRLTRTGDKETYSATPVIAGLRCQIIPATNDIGSLQTGVLPRNL